MEEDENKLNESFISRWSKRKSGIVSDEDNLELNKNPGIDKDKKNPSKKDIDDNNYDELNDEELLEKFKLPNPDKIKKEKGLDVFFKDGVPDRLRQIALRRVWKLNPIIRFADAEINDYHEDFTDAATVIEGMQTAYQVGKGYLSEILENKDEETYSEKPKIEKLEAAKAKTKKKTRLTSEKKEKNVKKDEQANISHEKSDDNNIKNDSSEIDEKKLALEIKENGPLENAVEKPKPKMMVFRPRENDNDYH